MNMSGNSAAGSKNRVRIPYAAAGFTYIALLITIVMIGVILAAAGEIWHMATQREKERELLFVGDQFRRAINQYSRHTQAGSRRYPVNLEDLLKDPRTPNTQRYLRKIYLDPVTGSSEWGLVRGPSGEIFGVYSLSEDEPIKKRNFNFADAAFEDKTKYSEWVFMGTPLRYGSRPLRKP